MYRWLSAKRREVALSLGIEIAEEEDVHSPIKIKGKKKKKKKKKKEGGMFAGWFRYWKRIRMGSEMQVWHVWDEGL